MKTAIVTAIFLIFIALSAPDVVNSQMGGSAMHKEMSGQHHEKCLHEVMSMLQETMSILKGLNHKPTSEEKKKLTEMMDKLDTLMKEKKSSS